MRLEGIHHITAITGDAPRNVDFYTRVLGLRLVAKTVNQDDPSVYHLFYADERGRPGAELTFFEYPHATPGRAGAGMVHRIVSRVGSADALAFWARAAAPPRASCTSARATRCASPTPRAWRTSSWCATADAPLAAEHPDVPAELALQGFDGVRAYSAHARAQRPVLERLLGATPLGDDTWELRGEPRGGTIAYDPPPAEPGRQSAGTVHHVAWGTTVAEHPRWHELLRDAGVPDVGDHRPPLLPLDLLPRAQRRPVRDRRRRPRLHRRRLPRRGAGLDDHPAAAPRAPAERIEAILTPLPDPRAERSPAR